MHHQLKITPHYMAHIRAGNKRFETRIDDRAFQKGDTIELLEWENGQFTKAKSFMGVITHVSNYMQRAGYVTFGFEERTK